MHPELEGVLGLTGRVAVVTGAASGIGRQAAVTLAQAGADVVLADVSEDGLAKTAELVRETGRTAVTRRVDVTRREDVEALGEQALESFGRIDVWANVAGIIRYSTIIETSETDLRAIIDVNLIGVYYGIAVAGRIMSAAGRGSIISIASMGGEVAVPTLSVYGLTKAAVIHLTKTASAELGPAGVRVNSIAPGWIDTPMVAPYYTDADGNVDDAAHEQIISQRASVSALGITGVPTDISYCILYLASDAARFVTGQTMRPNGGTFMS